LSRPDQDSRSGTMLPDPTLPKGPGSTTRVTKSYPVETILLTKVIIVKT
jgi:hypothetical protein